MDGLPVAEKETIHENHTNGREDEETMTNDKWKIRNGK
jgi:hypothetical protein